MTNIARDDSPKKLAPIKTHDGMFRITNGQMIAAGVRGKPITDGGIPKNWETSDGAGAAHLRNASALGDMPDIVDKAARLPGKIG